MFTSDSYEDWRGIEVVDSSGQLIGEVLEVFLDSDTDAPEWVVVDAGSSADRAPDSPAGLPRLIPLSGLTFGEEALLSRWTKQQAADSPVDGDVQGISRSDEDRLYRYYGLDYPTHWVNDGMPGGAETVGIAGVAAEGRQPTGAEGRSTDAAASENEVDEPRRVRRARVDPSAG